MIPARAAVLAALALISSAPHAGAEDLRLALPLDCEMGKTCFIDDYVDINPEQGRQQDFACGYNSRDGHRGVDFSLLSFDSIRNGVAVRAAAPGVVVRTRDEMPDDPTMRGVTSQNACGNAVLLDHGEGWRTLYCHMRLGSVAVEEGHIVQTGDVLGLVGLSGQTNHPHLHLTVQKDGKVVDPFRPEPGETCGVTDKTLWADPPVYTPTFFVTAGFSDGVPDMKAVFDGSARKATVLPDSPIVLYVNARHLQAGDKILFSIEGPAGTDILRHEMTIDGDKTRLTPSAGRRAPKTGWPAGDYLGHATILRGDTLIAHRFAHVTVAD
ncbi:M23 family metallopeptidase [Antarctobacter jejuensis]|uniref:M23 family metallopeptidase n=1 Tax=Antarctobacter jejuensis TaxID=1439938 RepID=UPI003FCFC3A4